MVDEIQITTLRSTHDNWRIFVKACDLIHSTGKVMDAVRRRPDITPELLQSIQTWDRLANKFLTKVRALWMALVCSNEFDYTLFHRYHREFEVSSPVTRFATVSYYVNETFQRSEVLRDIGSMPTLLNLVHCARCHWDDFSDRERQRTIEVLAASILTGMVRRPYRQLSDLASQVAISLLEYPAPKFMSSTIICRTPEDKENIQKDLASYLMLSKQWWEGFARHCLSGLDKDFRPKKLEIVGTPTSISDDFLPDELIGSCFDQADPSYEADILQHVSNRETVQELLCQFGARTQQVLNLISQGFEVAEAAEQLGVGPETVKTSLKRARKKAKASAKMAVIGQDYRYM